MATDTAPDPGQDRITTTAATVVGCQRLGHPQDYAHEHPYVSALCNDGYHDTCSWVAAFGKIPGYCDCECHA